MKIDRITPVDWEGALDRLSAGAYFLLSVMYHKDIHINDKSLMMVTTNGLSAHRKYKRELLDASYISSEQIGKGLYCYKVGDKV